MRGRAVTAGARALRRDHQKTWKGKRSWKRRSAKGALHVMLAVRANAVRDIRPCTSAIAAKPVVRSLALVEGAALVGLTTPHAGAGAWR